MKGSTKYNRNREDMALSSQLHCDTRTPWSSIFASWTNPASARDGHRACTPCRSRLVLLLCCDTRCTLLDALPPREPVCPRLTQQSEPSNSATFQKRAKSHRDEVVAPQLTTSIQTSTLLLLSQTSFTAASHFESQAFRTAGFALSLMLLTGISKITCRLLL